MGNMVAVGTPLVTTADVPAGSTLGPTDRMFYDAWNGTAYQTRCIYGNVLMQYSRIPLIDVTANHAVAPGEFGFSVVGAVTISLPDLISWAGAEMLFFNASLFSTAAQFTLQAAGTDMIVSEATGQPVGTILSGYPGSSFGLRKIVSPAGQTAWYMTRT